MRTPRDLDPFFGRTSKLAARRLKRGIERRETIRGAFTLEPDPSLKRIPTEESDSDLFRSDRLDAVVFPARAESPQSVVERCPAQGSAEQDHRRIKQRVKPMLGFKEFETAAVTIQWH
jgi:hypothetical protein